MTEHDDAPTADQAERPLSDGELDAVAGGLVLIAVTAVAASQVLQLGSTIRTNIRTVRVGSKVMLRARCIALPGTAHHTRHRYGKIAMERIGGDGRRARW
jgi:hypothetical protein